MALLFIVFDCAMSLLPMSNTKSSQDGRHVTCYVLVFNDIELKVCTPT